MLVFVWGFYNSRALFLVDVNTVVVTLSESHVLWKMSMGKISLVKAKRFIQNFLFWVCFLKNPFSPRNKTLSHTDSIQDDCSSW